MYSGTPKQPRAGRALKFYASVRVDIRRIASIKDGERVVGNRTKVKIVKNKIAAPFREAEFDILYGEGISREGDLIDVAAERNILEKSGVLVFLREVSASGRAAKTPSNSCATTPTCARSLKWKCVRRSTCRRPLRLLPRRKAPLPQRVRSNCRLTVVADLRHRD